VNITATPDDRLGPGGSDSGELLPRWHRWLLPAILGAEDAGRDASGGSDLPRSLRDWLADIVLFGFAVLVGLAFLVSVHDRVSSTVFAIDVVLMIPASLSLWVRRRHPVAVGWLAVGVALVSDGAAGAAFVALFTVAVHCAPRRTLQLALLAAVDGATGSVIYAEGHSALGRLVSWLAVTVAVVGFGLYVRARRELLLSLRDRARRAENEQQLQVREAQLAERSRIAREMHDVLAHRISLLSVHAGALEFNPDASPEQIARAAGVIRVSARAAQEELREVIGVLRADAAEVDDVQPPQPTIADLPRLIEESRSAGMDVSMSNTLEQQALPPILGRTAYRLIQEGLTNARKHAHSQVVTIAIEGDRTAEVVRVEVVNRPRVGQSDSSEAHAQGVEAARGSDHVGSGMGLVGIAERVTLVGGRLISELLPEGGFKLIATLPWSDPEADEQPAE
jgi:signal transduction histidine kinase